MLCIGQSCRGICAIACVLAVTSSWLPNRAWGQVDLTLNVGVKGGMNFSMLSEPSEDRIDLPVPGFGGFSGGVGLVVEALFADIVGLELGVMYVNTEGTGELQFPAIGAEVDETITTSEIHIPVLLKAQLPTGPVHPYLAVGLTFVEQTDGDFTVIYRDEEVLPTEAVTMSYSMLTLALGLAIEAGPVRIPVEFRGLYQSLDDDPEERSEWVLEGGRLVSLGLNTAWEGQVWFLVGVEYSMGL